MGLKAKALTQNKPHINILLYTHVGDRRITSNLCTTELIFETSILKVESVESSIISYLYLFFWLKRVVKIDFNWGQFTIKYLEIMGYKINHC